MSQPERLPNRIFVANPMCVWFHRRRRVEVELIDALLKGELERRKAQSELDSKLAEIELRKREMELQNIAAIGEERRKDAADRQKLREDRREWARKARLRKRGVSPEPQAITCGLCLNPLRRDVTWDMVKAHQSHMPSDVPVEGDANRNGL